MRNPFRHFLTTGALVVAEGDMDWCRVTINSATIYVVFGASRKGHIKSRLADKVCSLGKSRNAELAFS